jgi:hypothetical protein
MNQELQDYIKKARGSGMNDEQIKQELLKAGWKAQDINPEFGGISALIPTPIAPKVETFSETTEPKNKSKLPTIALIVVIAVLLIAGGVLGYNYLIKPSAPKNVADNNVVNQEDQDTNNETVKLNNEETTSKTTENAATIKDCGTIDMQSVFSNLSLEAPLTGVSTKTAESLRCMDANLANCQQAKSKIIINKTTLFPGTEMNYEIKGKNGKNCLIYGPFGKNEEYQTCEILPTYPTEVKAELTQYSDSSGLVFFSTVMEISTNAAFVPSDFIGSSKPIGPVEYSKIDNAGTFKVKFYNYNCK